MVVKPTGVGHDVRGWSMLLTNESIRAWTAPALAFAWVAFVWAWDPSILTLTVDDSFYYLNTALHAARGEGFTFDGLHPTNGFHPLWMLILVPIAHVFGSNPDTFTRVVLTLQVLLVSGGTLVLVRTVATPTRPIARSSLFATALFLNFYFTKVFVNGLESALQYACICATLACSWDLDEPQAFARAGTRRLMWLALACAATTLARLSAAGFSLATLVMVAHQSPRGRPHHHARLALMVALYAVPVATYFVAEHHRFGHWLPVSAAIKGAYQGVFVLPLLLTLVASVAAVRIFLHVAPRALPLVVYACGQSCFDAGVRGLLVPELWYLVPHATLVLILVLSLRRVPVSASWTAVALFAAMTLWSWRLRFRPESYAAYTSARSIGMWIEQNTEPRAIIGGWDCGIVAAYSRRRVVNLDGLINSWEYKERYLDTGRVQAFIDHEGGLDYVAQPVSVDALETETGVFVAHGVDLSDWHLAHVECSTFHSVLSRSNEVIAHLVLARAPTGPQMKNVVGPNALRVCGGARGASPGR